MKMYHGTRNEFAAHIGICVTNDLMTAESYAQKYGRTPGKVYELDLKLTGLDVVRVADYDRDADHSIGDAGEIYPDADVIVFDDEDMHNRSHRTWRIMTQAGLDALAVVGCVTDEDDE